MFTTLLNNFRLKNNINHLSPLLINDHKLKASIAASLEVSLTFLSGQMANGGDVQRRYSISSQWDWLN